MKKLFTVFTLASCFLSTTTWATSYNCSSFEKTVGQNFNTFLQDEAYVLDASKIKNVNVDRFTAGEYYVVKSGEQIFFVVNFSDSYGGCMFGVLDAQTHEYKFDL